MDQQKLNFVKTGFMESLSGLTESTPARWGKMNVVQMVEHVAGFFRLSSGKIVFPLVTPVEALPRIREFLFSEKEFRENTRAPENVVPAEPFPERHASLSEAVDALKKEIGDFTAHFVNNPGAKTMHPVFGGLDHGEWVLLHYKHMVHHAKQFGIL